MQAYCDFWTKRLQENIWYDEFTVANIPMKYPSRDRTVQLILNEPNSKWIDNISTPAKETLNDLVTESFKFACDTLERRFWAYWKRLGMGKCKAHQCPHLAKIPGFGSKPLMIRWRKNDH